MNTYKAKVDSCKLSIPLKECVIINSQLTEKVTTIKYIEDTAEHVNTVTKQGEPIVINTEDGLSFKVYLDNQLNYIDGQRVTEPYLTVLLNSKLLKGNYFEGINKNTFNDLYKYVMSTNTFMCSYDAFKSARYNDLDICFDFKSTKEQFLNLNESLKKSFLNTSLLHTINKSDNLGMYTPSKKAPRQQATPSKPFIKFYSKELDMEYNSTSFAMAYLKESDYKDLYRFECTISNSKHKKRLAIDKVKTIFDLLQIDLQSICSDMIKEYIDKPIIAKKTSMKPSKEIYLNLIEGLIEHKAPLNKIREYFTLDSTIHNRPTRNAYKELYYELISDAKIDIDNIKLSSDTNTVFNYLGINKV
tara:strand:- start:659 stop:1735 length:1077 start_codon:yes stop_codon:yes gene_type:complete